MAHTCSTFEKGTALCKTSVVCTSKAHKEKQKMFGWAVPLSKLVPPQDKVLSYKFEIFIVSVSRVGKHVLLNIYNRRYLPVYITSILLIHIQYVTQMECESAFKYITQWNILQWTTL